VLWSRAKQVGDVKGKWETIQTTVPDEILFAAPVAFGMLLVSTKGLCFLRLPALISLPTPIIRIADIYSATVFDLAHLKTLTLTKFALQPELIQFTSCGPDVGYLSFIDDQFVLKVFKVTSPKTHNTKTAPPLKLDEDTTRLTLPNVEPSNHPQYLQNEVSTLKGLRSKPICPFSCSPRSPLFAI